MRTATPVMIFACRLYVIAGLVAAGMLSPLVYAVIPWIILLLHVYLEFSRNNSGASLVLYLLIIFFLPLYFEPVVGMWISPLFAVPVLPLLDRALRTRASGCHFEPSKPGIRLNGFIFSLLLPVALVSVAASLIGAFVLLMTCGLVLIYIVLTAIITHTRLKQALVEAQVKSFRVIAGSHNREDIELFNKAGIGGRVKIITPYSWLKLQPDDFIFATRQTQVVALFTPPLSGPETVIVEVHFLDARGFMQVGQKLELIKLFVISRARHATWLANEYLKKSKAGPLEAQTTDINNARYPVRSGTEFFGVRGFQPGDSLKTVNWKATSKFGQLIVKEYIDTTAEKAAVLVNLSVVDDEQKDQLVAALVTTVLTMAKNNIPSAIGAYNRQGVVAKGGVVSTEKALMRALKIAREVEKTSLPIRYLETPDVRRLKSNVYRLKNVQAQPAQRLAELLELEFLALNETAKDNPATFALKETLELMGGNGNIVFVSGCNHDAEAIDFSRDILEKKGHSVVLYNLKQKTTA